MQERERERTKEKERKDKSIKFLKSLKIWIMISEREREKREIAEERPKEEAVKNRTDGQRERERRENIWKWWKREKTFFSLSLKGLEKGQKVLRYE